MKYKNINRQINCSRKTTTRLYTKYLAKFTLADDSFQKNLKSQPKKCQNL